VNPYQTPSSADVAQNPLSAFRAKFMLAAVGAFLASGYWALLTFVLGVGAAAGMNSSFRLLLPCMLIGLYAVRGVQLLKGDLSATTRILWLHGAGGAVAIIQMFQLASTGPLVLVFQLVKLAIHVFGAVTAWSARRAVMAGAR
jgi:hypothetical protein